MNLGKMWCMVVSQKHPNLVQSRFSWLVSNWDYLWMCSVLHSACFQERKQFFFIANNNSGLQCCWQMNRVDCVLYSPFRRSNSIYPHGFLRNQFFRCIWSSNCDSTKNGGLSWIHQCAPLVSISLQVTVLLKKLSTLSTERIPNSLWSFWPEGV